MQQSQAAIMEPPTAALIMVARADKTQLCLPVQEEYPKIPKRHPYDCPGSQAQDNCLTVTGGDPMKKREKLKKVHKEDVLLHLSLTNPI